MLLIEYFFLFLYYLLLLLLLLLLLYFCSFAPKAEDLRSPRPFAWWLPGPVGTYSNTN